MILLSVVSSLKASHIVVVSLHLIIATDSCCWRTECSWARAASSWSHSSNKTAAMAMFLVWGGTVIFSLKDLGGDVTGGPVDGWCEGGLLFLENLSEENIFKKLELLLLNDKSDKAAGREIIDVFDWVLLGGWTRLVKSSLACLTAISAPNNPGITESMRSLDAHYNHVY